MPRTKRAARKRCASDAGNFYANGSMSTTTQPGTVIDSYRPGQERDETNVDDQPMQDSAEPVRSSKRRKAAGGDFYRPSFRRSPRPLYEPPLENDAGDNMGTLGHRRSPPPPPPPSRKLLKAEKRQMKLAKIQSKIQNVQRQLRGCWVDAELRLETERLLAGYQADLKAWRDRGSPNNPQKRYNHIRSLERKQSQKALNKARTNEKVLQKDLAQAKAHETALGNRLSMNRSQLRDASVTVSDDEEEGGVLLTGASTTETRNHDAIEEPSAVQSSESIGRAHRSNGKHSETMSNAAHVKLQRIELEQTLAEAKRLVHIAEVDINYCCFAPLDQQYICLFPTDEYGRIIADGKKRRKNARRPDPDPEEELRKDLEAGILRTNIGSKPPLWDEIEEKMKAGLFNGLTDTLGLGVDEHSLTEVGGKVDALQRAMGGRSLKRRPSWMDDDIAPEDLDSESDSDADDEDDEDSD